MWHAVKIIETTNQDALVLRRVVLPPGRKVDHPGGLVPLPAQVTADPLDTCRHGLVDPLDTSPNTSPHTCQRNPGVVLSHARREAVQPEPVTLRASKDVDRKELVERVQRLDLLVFPEQQVELPVP